MMLDRSKIRIGVGRGATSLLNSGSKSRKVFQAVQVRDNRWDGRPAVSHVSRNSR